MSGLRFDTVDEAVGLLRQAGFRVVAERFDAANFGDAYIDTKRGEVLLRVVRDRGDHSVLLASTQEPEEWFDAELVLKLLNVQEIKTLLTADAATDAARQIIDVLRDPEHAFARARWPKTKEKLREFQMNRRKALFGF
jgi:hypothetical protein